MTGYTVHTGASEKFVEGWDRIFGGSKPKQQSAGKTRSQSKKSPKPKQKKK